MRSGANKQEQCLQTLSGRRPDFARLRAALYCQQPDAVPALELFHDIEVKEAFLGRPVRSIADDIYFEYGRYPLC